MNSQERTIGRGLTAVGLVTTAGLVYNMIALRVYRKEFFWIQGEIEWEGYLVMGIFLVLFLFTVASVLWFTFADREPGASRGANAPLVLFGVLCLIALMGVKVMLDELGREDVIGAATGEWIVMYVLLIIQMFFNLSVLKRLSPAARTQ